MMRAIFGYNGSASRQASQQVLASREGLRGAASPGNTQTAGRRALESEDDSARDSGRGSECISVSGECLNAKKNERTRGARKRGRKIRMEWGVTEAQDEEIGVEGE